MDYFAAYMARVNALGSSPKERELNASIREFEKYLREHPSVEKVTIGKQVFPISILSNKQDTNRLTKQILSALETPIVPGTLINWQNSDWIVFKQEHNPNEAYHSSYMVQCNSTLRWINNFGIMNTVSCYLKGSMESIIKENFRSWNNIIVPQPNQTLGCIVPTRDIKISQKFIIDERAWEVVDYDRTSIDGIMYLSLTESKIDALDDSIENEVANIGDLNSYKIIVAETKIECDRNTNYTIKPLVYKNDVLQSDIVKCNISRNTINATYIYSDGVFTLRATAYGITTIKFYLESDEKVYITIPFECKASPIYATTYEVIGNATIKMGRQTEYYVLKHNPDNVQSNITFFTISDSTLASGTLVDGKLVVTANSRNKIGEVVLTVHSEDHILTKTVKIIPLW